MAGRANTAADMQEGRADTRQSLGSNNSRGDKLGAGWGKVFFGLIFLGAGIFIVLVATDVIATDDSSIHVPRWVLGVAGGIFAAPGLAICINGVRGALRRRRLELRAQQNPDAPWLGDYEWNTTHSRDDGGGRAVKNFIVAGFIGVFTVPFAYVGFFEDGAWPFAIGAVVMALVCLGVLWHAVYLVMRRLKYGGGRIEYDRFPLMLGSTLEARWTGTKPIGRYNRITFTLRCVEEQIEVRGSGKNRSKQYVRYQRWADTYEVEGPGEHRAGQSIPLTFLPPGDLPTTELRRNPPRYWEVEIHADTPGVDFKQTYLVPVYATTAAQAAG